MIHLAKDHMHHKRIKYIDVRYHMTRHWVIVENIIDLVKISTKKNPADMYHPGGEVQSIFELHQCSPEVR